MTTPYSGQPATVENNLPAPVNISMTTFTTPIVITTATPHGLQTGDYFTCTGADEPALNGAHLMAGMVTSTTVVALVAPAGTNTVGTLAGGAAGTLINQGFGVTVPILADGDAPTASLWNVAFEAILDRLAWLVYAKTSQKRTTAVAPAVNSTLTIAYDIWRCTAPLAHLTHTVADAPDEGFQVTIWRSDAGAFDIDLKREDATPIATLPTATQSSVTLTFYTSGGWQVTDGYAFTF